MTNSELSSGVYFSANDAVYEWTVAFLNSFRQFNPKLRLILIPFDANIERLIQLQPQYGFEIYQDKSFAELEEIGQLLELGHTSSGPHWFRRYAAFWGPLDEFLYLDARVLTLADLEPLVRAPSSYDFDLLHYDCALNQVYQPGPLRRQILRAGRGRGFLSGMWASRKSLFTLDEFEKLGQEALAVRDQLNPRNTDQAFINYCCDMKPVRCGHFAEVLGGICQFAWAHQPGKIYKESGKYYLWDYGAQDHKKQIVLLHWAGLRLNALMPHRRLFQHFHLLDESIPVRKQRLFSFAAEYGLKSIFESARHNRVVNTLYHRIHTK